MVSSYTNAELPSWSDEKLAVNIKCAEEQVAVGSGDDYSDFEAERFLAGLIQEAARRKKLTNNQGRR